MSATLYQRDLPSRISLGPVVAVDTETMGLDPARDPLCLVQLSGGDGSAHMVQFDRAAYDAPNLKRLLADENVLKIFHFARFDMAMIARYLDVTCQPVYCTKIASKLARTYTDKHGLKDLVREFLGIDMSKQQQSSDWGSGDLSDAQLAYAAADVLHLHAIKARLDDMLAREDRMELAKACFEFLPARARLDLRGWAGEDIFSH